MANPLILCQNILSDKNQITEIKFFTAKISATKDDPQKSTRQQFYMRALNTIDKLKIILGHFNTHHVKMRLVTPIEIESTIPFINRVEKKTIEMVEVIKYEEKGSDVNIASEILIDGFNDKYEALVLISNDSDLEAPIKYVKQVLKKKIIILNPHKNHTIQLKRYSSYITHIQPAHLQQSLFPDQLQDSKGIFRKPSEW